MKESTYNPCFFYTFGLFDIIEIQINDILILANNNFVSKEKAAIKSAKIITKDCK